MAFDHLNRGERRAMRKYSVSEAAKRPVRLTELPRSQWPASMVVGARHAPSAVWISQRYLVQMFDELPFNGITVIRLTVCRTTLGGDGHWDAALAWEELQQIKSDVGFGSWYGLELYPRDIDVVNVANMRHLWLLEQPLSIGWFK
jgi:hypothetical protein